MSISIEKKDDYCLVKSSLDYLMGHRDELVGSIEKIKDTYHHIAIDLTDVNALFSDDLGFLISMFKEARDKDISFSVVNTNSSMYDLMEATNFTLVVPVYKTIDDYAASLG